MRDKFEEYLVNKIQEIEDESFKVPIVSKDRNYLVNVEQILIEVLNHYKDFTNKNKSISKIDEIDDLKYTIKMNVYHAGNGIYNGNNQVGIEDTNTIYRSEHIMMNISHSKAYLIIFGLTEDEFKDVEEYYYSLVYGEDYE